MSMVVHRRTEATELMIEWLAVRAAIERLVYLGRIRSADGAAADAGRLSLTTLRVEEFNQTEEGFAMGRLLP